MLLGMNIASRRYKRLYAGHYPHEVPMSKSLGMIFVRDAEGFYRLEGRATFEQIATGAAKLLQAKYGNRKLLTAPAEVREWLAPNLTEREHEVFWVMYIDNRHRVIAHEELCGRRQGTTGLPVGE